MEPGISLADKLGKRDARTHHRPWLIGNVQVKKCKAPSLLDRQMDGGQS
jgi:hypothetical protein